MFNLKSTDTKKPTSHIRSKSSPYLQDLGDAPTFFHSLIADHDGYRDILLAPPAALTSHPPRAEPRPLLEITLPQRHPTYRPTLNETILPRPQLPQLVTSSKGPKDSSLARTSVIPLESLSKDLNLYPTPEQSPLPSPNKENWTFMANLTGDKSGQVKVETKGIKVADWFKGESEPVSIGILPSPIKEKADPLDSFPPPVVPQGCTQLLRKSTLTPASRPQAASTSRFSFFGTKAAQAPSPPLPAGINDEFVHLNVRAALLPGGQGDPPSPSSFKNLLQNAEDLLTRLQSAYKQRTVAIQELTAEKEVQAEELAEARTKTRHLKLQLEEMALNQTEQDGVIMNLVDELAREKQLRKEDGDTRMRSVRLVENDERVFEDGKPRLRQRTSRANTVSDSGFESDDESYTESVFSKPYSIDSPTIPTSSASSILSPDTSHLAGLPPLTSTAQAARRRLGIRIPALTPQQGNVARNCCPNCEGAKASEAWNVVGILKEENKCLKQRVGELEGALDECLDLVRGSVI